jgi:methylase of polypeptide subunit release factors
MTVLTVKQFVDKWKAIELKEITIAQSHFIDICDLLGHPAPLDCDPKGEFFTFEIVTDKTGGGKGRADAWYKAKFIWEYKRPHWSLDKAYNQLLLYRESLGNPPLLITSDTHKIIIHTNFTNTAKKIYEIDFDRLLTGDGLELLKHAFHDPQFFEPDQTKEQVTKATANTFVEVAKTLQKWTSTENRRESPEQLAHFIIRLLFSLFAEDMKLLPNDVFTQLVTYKDANIAHFTQALHNLFAAMRTGGFFGIYKIPYFDGGLFDDDFVPELPSDILYTLRDACSQDWSSIDPSIFGTLFERIIDESKRAQLGLHYTSADDIMLIVQPVLMKPLRDRWVSIKQQVRELLQNKQLDEAHNCLSEFASEIAHIRVLDPACGSGNFLYVALRQLLDLQKEIITFSGQNGLPDIPLTVSPAQLYGIEINPYAHELAQTTVWIGYLQWRFDNGFTEITEPILRPLHNIQMRDAILTNADHEPKEPSWQETDVIIGNPPFLGGGRRMREELGDDYVEQLMELYRGRVPGGADLVCYWFEKARAMLEKSGANRVGLLATQSIRGGANRKVLGRIKKTGDIFMAWSDREWIQEGVMVHISMVGFDRGDEQDKTLDGVAVTKINTDLTSKVDLTLAQTLVENADICFRGVTKTGNFELTQKQAKEMLSSPNASNHPNSDVIKPSINAIDIALRPRHIWLIDFDGLGLEEAKQYEKPFEYVLQHVKPFRETSRQQVLKDNWWLFEDRFIVTPLTSKHKLYIWVKSPTLPDQASYIFAREDDYFFGILHSCIHEIWVRRKGTQLREAESGSRYSPSETFETFPFPWVLGKEPEERKNDGVRRIATQSRRLDSFRQNWLNPDKLVGDTIGDSILKKRTLTSLYNALEYYQTNFKTTKRDIAKWEQYSKKLIRLDEVEELDQIYNELNDAVFDCYGWDSTLSDEEILEKLLALNLERIKAKP